LHHTIFGFKAAAKFGGKISDLVKTPEKKSSAIGRASLIQVGGRR
jgi:hypothetical protein